MKVKGEKELIPQMEEDIHEIKWVKAGELVDYIKNSFPSVVDVLEMISSH